MRWKLRIYLLVNLTLCDCRELSTTPSAESWETGWEWVVLATVSFLDCFDYSGCKKTRNRHVRLQFLPNSSVNKVHQYWLENLKLGIWNIQHCIAPLLVVSNVRYLWNLASNFENRVIIGPKTMFFRHCLLSFDDIDNWRPPKDAPCKATYFPYQALNGRINIGGLNWAVRLKNRRLLMW